MAVRVETRGEFTRGMTVRAGGEPNVEVTTGMNVEAVRELYLRTVLE
jgi:inosine-uridine nucleoside N-ribohydrolase